MKKYTPHATEDFLKWVSENGPVTKADMIEAGWYSRIKGRLSKLVALGCLVKEQVPNESSERWARSMVAGWLIGPVPYVRWHECNLSPEGRVKAMMNRSEKALRKRLDFAIALLTANGYSVSKE